MLSPDVYGQSLARAFLSRALASGRYAHAYLLVGPEGVGKRRFADGIARAVLCAQGGVGAGDPEQVGACGACSSCAVPLDTHPATQALEAPPGGTIEISAVREAITSLSLRSGDRRTVLIDGVERLGEPAANALLKILEEPPPGIIFLLITSRPAHLLETIHSRAQRVPFSALSVEEFATAVGPLPAGIEAASLCRATGGSPGLGLRLAAGIESCGGPERFRELLDGVGGERPQGLIDYLPAEGKETARARAHRLLELVQVGLWGDRSEDPEARRRAGARAILVGELLRGLRGGRSVELTLEILSRVLRARDIDSVSADLPRSFFATTS